MSEGTVEGLIEILEEMNVQQHTVVNHVEDITTCNVYPCVMIRDLIKQIRTKTYEEAKVILHLD